MAKRVTDPAQMTAGGLFNTAVSFHRSADNLLAAKVKVTHREFPVRFLYYHALELYLKAFLRMKGDTPDQLLNLGHKFGRMRRKAERLGLPFGSEDHWVMS